MFRIITLTKKQTRMRASIKLTLTDGYKTMADKLMYIPNNSTQNYLVDYNKWLKCLDTHVPSLPLEAAVYYR